MSVLGLPVTIWKRLGELDQAVTDCESTPGLQSIADDLEKIESGFVWIARSSIPTPKNSKHKVWREDRPFVTYKVSFAVAKAMLEEVGRESGDGE